MGSKFQGAASMTALETDMMESRFLAIGPITDGTCSWPSVETGTPWYGSRVLYPGFSGRTFTMSVASSWDGLALGQKAYAGFKTIQAQHVGWDAYTPTNVCAASHNRALKVEQIALPSRRTARGKVGIFRMHCQTP